MDWHSAVAELHTITSGVFGRTVSHVPRNGARQDGISAKFDMQALEADVSGVPTSRKQRSLVVSVAVLTQLPVRDDAFVIDGKRYLVAEVLPDDYGEVEIKLGSQHTAA